MAGMKISLDAAKRARDVSSSGWLDESPAERDEHRDDSPGQPAGSGPGAQPDRPDQARRPRRARLRHGRPSR
jgi:hypothetical protein